VSEAGPLVWTLSAPDEHGARSTFHDGGEGTVRVVEQSAYVALQKAIAERDRLAELNAETVQRVTGENLRLCGALRTLANPNVEEWEASPYVKRMADFARAALDPTKAAA